MYVKAIKQGYDGKKIREVGECFEFDVQKVGSWFVEVSKEKPAKAEKASKAAEKAAKEAAEKAAKAEKSEEPEKAEKPAKSED